MAKEQLSKRQEELAKWVMDLAKYIITGLVISPIFGGMENKWMMVAFGAVIAIILLKVGLSILDAKPKTKQTTKKRK